MNNKNNDNPCPSIGINVGITADSRSFAVSGIGGEAPYTYSINGDIFQTSDTFSNLSPGDYEIWAKDKNGCIGTKNILLPPPQNNQCPNIIVNTSVTPLTGTISVGALNGEEPYKYSLDNITYQSSGIFMNLQPGTYTVWVLDKNNCPCTRNITLPAPNN